MTRFATMIGWFCLLHVVGAMMFLAEVQADQVAAAVRDDWNTRDVRGWTVRISRDLLDHEPELTARALELLDRQLDEIVRVVPPIAVAELRKVRLHFHAEYAGRRPTAEYHPDVQWLRDNGRDPEMAQGVEFTNVRIFAAEVDRMPNFVLHELAHAFHDRVLPDGYAHAALQAAHANALAGGGYERVERRLGGDRLNTFERAYALTNPMEYFAECSEAYFSRNDYFPFDREQLQRHDPAMFQLLGELWSSAPVRSP